MEEGEWIADTHWRVLRPGDGELIARAMDSAEWAQAYTDLTHVERLLGCSTLVCDDPGTATCEHHLHGLIAVGPYPEGDLIWQTITTLARCHAPRLLWPSARGAPRALAPGRWA
jgi:hypothetical protein